MLHFAAMATALVLLCTASAQAANVSGNISNATWTKDSTYHVIGPITVVTGNTLTIEPGVDVLFDADVQFRVEGSIVAVGTEQDSIRFLKGSVAEWGGLRITGGTGSTITYARISGGHAEGGDADFPANAGGGVYLGGSATRLSLDHVVLSDNRADNSGGGILVYLATLNADSCAFVRNTAYYGGGGLYVGSGRATLTRCVVAKNVVSAGYPYGASGGVAAHDLSVVTLDWCTVTGNRARLGAAFGSSQGAQISVKTSIVWGNIAQGVEVGTDQVWYGQGGTVSMSYTDAQSGWSGAGNIVADPLFSDAPSGDYRLSAGSLCIDAGDPVSPSDPDGTRADMGVFYFHQTSGGEPGPCDSPITTTTWTKANSPYRITCGVTVPSGDTLAIEAGVDVLFDEDVKFSVEGTLRAIGTPKDSVRFMKGNAPEWSGIRIVGGGKATIAFARVSGARNDDPPPDDQGGGILVGGIGSRLDVTNSVISDNETGVGGGICVRSGATATVSFTLFADNTGVYGGGAVDVRNARGSGVFSEVELRHCVMARNKVTSGFPYGSSGALLAIADARARLINCTIVGNSARLGGAIGSAEAAQVAVSNSVIWGNVAQGVETGTDQIWLGQGGTVTASYSDIQNGWPGVGNINADPLFVDAASRDYRLSSGSPCIDAGDPGLLPDPDGTRADMGAFYFHQLPPEELALPKLLAHPGDTVLVPIRATFTDMASADLAFLFDTTALTPLMPDFLRSHALQERTDPPVDWSVLGDTVRISLVPGISMPISLEDAPLATVAFVVRSDAPTPTDAALVWLPAPETNVNEQSVNAVNGFVRVREFIPYGDVTNDGEITAFDASLVLRYVVRHVREIDRVRADVTGDGSVSSYDAAHVLAKVLDPTYLFPVERAILPKVTPDSPRAVAWARDGSGWALRMENPSGLLAGEMTLAFADDAPVRATGGDLIASRQEGPRLVAAFVRRNSGDPVLIRLEGEGELVAAPEILDARFNEGQIPLAGVTKPLALVLEQNAPNPFNPSTSIRYTTPARGVVYMAICDVNGRLVCTLVDGTVNAGTHHVIWDGRDARGREVASGVYLYRLTAEAGTVVRKMTLVR